MTPLWKKSMVAIVAPIVFVGLVESLLWGFATVYWRDEAGAAPAHDPAATRTVLALGDSFTYGLFVDSADSYPSQLRELLDSSHDVRWNIDSVGRPGASPMMLHRELDAILARHQPDLVLLLAGFNINDGDIVFHRAQVDRNLPVPGVLPRLSVQLQRLRTFRMVGQLAQRLRPATREPVDRPRGRMELFSFRSYQEVNRFALRALTRELLDRGVEVMLLNYPQAPVPSNPADEQDEYYYATYMKQTRPLTDDDYVAARLPGETAINAVIRGISQEFDLPLVDNYSEFESLADKPAYFVANDEHPNRRGYAVMAAAIERTLIERGQLTRRSADSSAVTTRR